MGKIPNKPTVVSETLAAFSPHTSDLCSCLICRVGLSPMHNTI